MKFYFAVFIFWMYTGYICAQDTLVFNKLSTLPTTPKNECGYFVIDSNFYVVGGGDSVLSLFKEVWRYDIVNNSWRRMNDFGGQQGYGYGSFVINGQAYLCFGSDSNGLSTAGFWKYDPVNDSWTQKADIPTGNRTSPSMFEFEGKGYAGFGVVTSGRDLWRYDPDLDIWSAMDSLPSSEGRYGNRDLVIDSFAYFVGGYLFPSSGATNEVWRYSILNNSWERKSDFPGLARGFGLSWAFDKSIIYGMGSYIDTIAHLLGDVYVYNCITDVWKPMVFKNFVTSSGDGFCFSFGNKGYYFGGVRRFYPNYSYLGDLWSFDATALLPVGVSEIKANKAFKIYPNPISSQGLLSISAPESGEINFYNSLGQLLYTTSINSGINKLACDQLYAGQGLIFYSARFKSNIISNGKIVISE